MEGLPEWKMNLVSLSEIREMTFQHLNEEEQEEEEKLHGEISKLFPTYLKVQKMLTDYKEKFGVEFDLDLVVEEEEEEEVEKEVKLFANLTSVYERSEAEKSEQLPKGQEGCKVYGGRNVLNFSYDLKLCHACKGAKSDYSGQSCNRVLQLIGDCPLVCNLSRKCKRCRVAKIAELQPEYYDGKNLAKSDGPPPEALPGRYANLMKLTEVGTNWFVDGEYKLENTHCFLIRVINFSEKKIRQLINLCIRVKSDDPRLENAYGIQQLMRCIHIDVTDDNDGLFLVHVDHGKLPWTPDDPLIALCCYYCMLLVDYLLNPRLNGDARQSMRTDMIVSTSLSKYITIEFINRYLAKRGCTEFNWSPTTQHGSRLSGPGRGARTGFNGCVYAYVWESGKIIVGSYAKGHPRTYSLKRPTAWAIHVNKNPKDPYFRVVLCHVPLDSFRS